MELKPASTNSIITVHIPTSTLDGTLQRSKNSPTPSFASLPHAKDEATFSSRFLASQSSIYFRERRTSPRSFLWRVLHGNRTLEIRCADLAKSGTDLHEASLTLRFRFVEPIVPTGVAFADPDDHDALNVFVVTASSRQLHTLTLRPECFKKRNTLANGPADWHQSCIPAPLTFAHPHRLVATNAYELFMSLDNGSLLRLARLNGEDGKLPLGFAIRTRLCD